MLRNLFSKRPHCGIKCGGGRTQQNYQKDCDLNAIIKKYPDGVPPPTKRPYYGDFTSMGQGLQATIEQLRFVEDWFMSLPAETRAKFDNDCIKARDFVISDPAGAVKLGILEAGAKPPAEGGQAPKEGAVAEPPKPATTTEEAPKG